MTHMSGVNASYDNLSVPASPINEFGIPNHIFGVVLCAVILRMPCISFSAFIIRDTELLRYIWTLCVIICIFEQIMNATIVVCILTTFEVYIMSVICWLFVCINWTPNFSKFEIFIDNFIMDIIIIFIVTCVVSNRYSATNASFELYISIASVLIGLILESSLDHRHITHTSERLKRKVCHVEFDHISIMKHIAYLNIAISICYVQLRVISSLVYMSILLWCIWYDLKCEIVVLPFTTRYPFYGRQFMCLINIIVCVLILLYFVFESDICVTISVCISIIPMCLYMKQNSLEHNDIVPICTEHIFDKNVNAIIDGYYNCDYDEDY